MLAYFKFFFFSIFWGLSVYFVYLSLSKSNFWKSVKFDNMLKLCGFESKSDFSTFGTILFFLSILG
jgi:hypothetical protein